MFTNGMPFNKFEENARDDEEFSKMYKETASTTFFWERTVYILRVYKVSSKSF